MAEIVRMPKLSDTMTEGVVAKWHKKVGDKVESGELLADIETDKATMEFESFQDGVLLHIGVKEGKTSPVDAILAIVGEKGEDVKALLAEDAKMEAKAVAEAEEAPVEEAPAVAMVSAPSPRPAPVALVAPPPSKLATSNSNGRVKASPLAKKLAQEKGINLGMVSGSGEDGRIVKRDVENFSGGSLAMNYTGVERSTDEPVSQMRKTIARRLADSKFSAPHFYLTMEMDMEPAMQARSSINAAIEPSKISFNDMIVKAAAHALKKHPNVNSSWYGDIIRRNEHVHVGVAVAVDEGLLVPVVRFADGKTLSQISAEVKVAAQKARDKKLQPEDWEGNTFTISNLGMFGIEEFTAIINTPDACILAIGGIIEKPVVKDGVIVPGHRMKVTLSCDHRVVDGVTGSEFLLTFKNYMENPVVFLGAASI